MISYFCIRLLALPLQWVPLSWIRSLGNFFGGLLFYLVPHWRKRVLSNLSLATGLFLSEEEKLRVAKASFQNLAIVCLEYPRLWSEKKLSSSIVCVNPDAVQKIYDQGKGVVFFCGHLSNWEVLFLEGNTRMCGIAAGKPIRNERLYRWIVAIREKYGGKIVAQSAVMKEGIRTLRRGGFVGIVGDQAMPSSGYSFPFLGRRAWTSTAPALLSYRTGSPLVVTWSKRTPQGYQIFRSDPIWPNRALPPEQEIPRMMDRSLEIFEAAVRSSPGEWLWQHNRWKQQTPARVYKRFRHDAVALFLPPNPEAFLPHLSTLRKIYPLEFLFLAAPTSCQGQDLSFVDELFFYRQPSDLFLNDQRCKLIFNFSGHAALKRHYLRRSALEVIDLPLLQKLAKLPKETDLSMLFYRALCRGPHA